MNPLIKLPLLLTAALALTGCRYTFVPLVPPLTQGTFPTRLADVGVTRDGDTLTLTATLQDARSSGYLSCVWYLGSEEVGRDTVFVDPQGRVARFKLPAPTRGAYRADLAFEGTVLRQVEYTDPPETPK